MLLLLLIFAGLSLPSYFLIPKSGQTWMHYVPFVISLAAAFTFVVIFSAAIFFIHDFAPLWMYRHGGTGWQAAGKIWRLAGENPGDFFLYLLIRLMMGIVFFFLSVLAGCLTCCLGFLPYLHSVLTLPLSVFTNWYAIECFAQLAPECDVRPMETPPADNPPQLPPVGL